VSVTHINIRGKRRHDGNKEGTCWCNPTVTTFRSSSNHRAEPETIVDHHDGLHASVAADLALTGELPHETPPRILGARKVG
jgi:hypothetical protein